MRLLITGADGFLAQSLISFIKNESDEIEIFGIDKRQLVNTFYKFEQIKFTPDMDWLKFINRYEPDGIIHTIGVFGKNELDMFNTNTAAFYNFLDAIRVSKFNPRVIIIGSSAQYGIIKPNMNPIKESTPLIPDNLYGHTKKWQEEISFHFYNNYNLKITSTRPSNFIGKGVSQNLLPGYLISKFSTKESEVLVELSSTNSKRDYIDVRDVSKAIMMLYHEKKTIGEVFNISSGKCTSNIKLVKIFEKITNKKAKITITNSDYKSFEICLSNEKIKKFVNWKQEYSLKQSVEWSLSK